MITDCSQVFLSLVDLDGVAHKYGTSSEQYLKYIDFLDSKISELVELYMEINQGYGEVIILSDHGMADVKEGFTLRLEKDIGPAGLETYLYFVDSTMMRIWILQDGLSERIESYLKNLIVGQIITKEERAKYGLRLKDAGDYFYILNEGYVFAPSFQRHRMDKAMHGYHPRLQSQHGIFLSNEKIDYSQSIESVEVFKLLSSFVETKNA
jgi:predicted AlkP superfamily pyrophosphatase or phosphodiesterase